MSILACGNTDHYGILIEIYNISTGDLMITLKYKSTDIYLFSMTFNFDNSLIACICRHEFEDRSYIIVWNVNTSEFLHYFEKTGRILSVSFYFNNELVCGSNDSMLNFWNLSTGECFKTHFENDRSITSLSYNKSCNNLLISTFGGSIRLRNTDTLELIFNFKDDLSSFISSNFNHDETLIISFSNLGIIKILEISSVTCIHIIETKCKFSFCDRIYSFTFSDNLIVLGSEDNILKVWQNDTEYEDKLVLSKERKIYDIVTNNSFILSIDIHTHCCCFGNSVNFGMYI